MTLWSAIVGGIIGTLVLTTLLRGASELGLTRMDIAFLLGTTVTTNRRKAKAIGYAVHFAIGIVIAIGYAAAFAVIGRATWWIGGLLGVLHAVFMSMVVVNVLLPVVHPRMATPDTAANDVALIEPPGFLMLNYGRNTFLITVAAHAAYGAIVGMIIRL